MAVPDAAVLAAGPAPGFPAAQADPAARAWLRRRSSVHSSPTCRSSSAREPELSTTMSAIASRCSLAGLGRHPRLRLLPGHPAQPHQPVELDPGRHIHHDDEVVGAGQVVLRDERHIVDQHRARARPAPRARACGHRPADGRSRSGWPASACRRTRRRRVRTRSSAPSGPSTSGPKAATTAARPSVPGATTSRAIRSASMIDRALSGQTPGYLALAGPDPAGQSYPQHLSKLSRGASGNERGNASGGRQVQRTRSPPPS